MATKAKVEVKEEGSKAKFYRSRLSGLKVVVNDQVADPTLVEYVRFTGVKEKFQGDTILVGYLKTSNKVAIEKLAGDPNVEEISAKEWKESTNAPDPEVEESEEVPAEETE